MEPNYDLIPEHCRESVRQYIEHGRPIGGFLTYLFANDFVRTFGQADTINRPALNDYATFLYNEAPLGCWGSLEKVADWIEHRGLDGPEVAQ